jgi:hypothetical protein
MSCSQRSSEIVFNFEMRCCLKKYLDHIRIHWHETQQILSYVDVHSYELYPKWNTKLVKNLHCDKSHLLPIQSDHITFIIFQCWAFPLNVL